METTPGLDFDLIAAVLGEAYGVTAEQIGYYRYERIIEDIAVTCEQVFLRESGNQAESLAQLAMQWRLRDVIEIADATYDRLMRGGGSQAAV